MKLFKIILLFLIVFLVGAIFFILFQEREVVIYPAKSEESLNGAEGIEEGELEEVTPKLLEIKPEVVKAIYLTSWSASSEKYIDYLINLARRSELNGVVIDVKDWSGAVFYETAIPEVEEYGAKEVRIRNIRKLIDRLHQEGIYLIARIVVFQDPLLAQARPDLAVRRKSDNSLWLDRSRLAWIDPGAKESWDYNIRIAQEVSKLGFDEVNFDYVRFPSDGDLKDMAFPFWDKDIEGHLMIREFFAYLRQQMPEARLSIDLFGLSAIREDDLGVGQIIEDAFAYFDYVCPMVYPSHYAPNFLGYKNPAEYPYEVVKDSLEKAWARLLTFDLIERRVKIRPWLQDFDLGAVYDLEKVERQIRASQEAAGDNFNGFMLWNSSNIYSEEVFNKF